MKRLKYVIIEDDDMDRLTLNFLLKDYHFLEHTASFSSPIEGKNFVMNNSVDILFMDINMPEMTGIEVQKLIGNRVGCTIFVSSYSEYALEGFNSNVFDYLVKPYDRVRMDTCLEQARQYLDQRNKASLFETATNQKFLFVKQGHSHHRILIAEIVYLEAMKDYTRICTRQGEVVTIHSNLLNMMRQENLSDFIRIHKSFAVNPNYIRRIVSNKLELINRSVLPVGNFYKKDILKALAW